MRAVCSLSPRLIHGGVVTARDGPILAMMTYQAGAYDTTEEASMAITPERDTNAVRFLDDDESHALFDREAQRLVGMSGEEFLRRFDAGEFAAEMDGPRHDVLARMVMLIPFGR